MPALRPAGAIDIAGRVLLSRSSNWSRSCNTLMRPAADMRRSARVRWGVAGRQPSEGPMRARETLRTETSARPTTLAQQPLDPLSAYLLDAAQRTVLFWDVLRQRGNQYLEHLAAAGAQRAAVRRRPGRGRPDPAAAGQLRAGAHHAAAWGHHRRAQASFRGGRPARGPRARNRRLQGRQRDRRGPGCRPPLLFHRLSARAHARPDHRGCHERGDRVPAQGGRAARPRPRASPW